MISSENIAFDPDPSMHSILNNGIDKKTILRSFQIEKGHNSIIITQCSDRIPIINIKIHLYVI